MATPTVVKDVAEPRMALGEPLMRLLRGPAGNLNAYLETLACDVRIASTKTSAHCYFLALDGNKRPRVKDFVEFIADHIVEFAAPRTEVNRAMQEAAQLNSLAPVNRLNRKVAALFTRIQNSGEGGEILLSMLSEYILKLPQVFTKMPHKTNSAMHVHGADGIHAGLNEENGNLALYWGESKLYQSASQAIQKCFSSLAPFLLGAGGTNGPQNRDLQLLRDHLDLNNPALEEALKRYLDPNNVLFKQLEYRGVCLVGFDSDAYPTQPNSKEPHELKTEIEATFEACKNAISNRVLSEEIHTFFIHIFCLPFPSVADFREAFRTALGLQ